ncbi:hypothetical protein [Enterovirga sp.]|jgi:hypothetical protein|uniref:hypothetical protein n=1 Tax=Enterovirga sp. TaxID=2026350 RepID=UPI002614C391|nr:hypothetical protein [Enterovirga sp.]MDB5592358.1 hypothetical protein [Enterovirga sp.]
MAVDPPDHHSAVPSEADVDAVLREFGGDAREAIRALLHDIAVLAGDFEASVSHGFVRGALPRLGLKRRV